ncbi:hypothetical protein ACNFBR_13600 [Pseudomonas sp. NY11955]|uniref:hypothetical protein n=1 Tax=Pseudomonas sp. NY11955 TaxID=3400363 RepID=UPI003A85B9AC
MKNPTSKHVLPKPNGTGDFKMTLIENGMPKLEHDFKRIVFSQRLIAGVDNGPDFVLSLFANDGTPDFRQGKFDVGPSAPCQSQLHIQSELKINADADSGHVDFKVVSDSRITGSYSCRYSANNLTYEAQGEFDIASSK